MKHKIARLIVLTAISLVPAVADADEEESATTQADIEILVGEDPIEPEIPKYMYRLEKSSRYFYTVIHSI